MFNVKYGILGFCGPRLTRGISNQEFVNATEELKVHYGRTMRVGRASKPTHIFIKRCPVNLKSGQAKTCARLVQTCTDQQSPELAQARTFTP